jgi:hypothetical protein
MKQFLFLLALVSGSLTTQSQDINSLIKKGKESFGSTGSQSETDQIVLGLKQALSLGAEKGAAVLSAEDGFFKNELLKIMLPPEAQKIEKTLRNMGMGKQVDEAILSMNRGAEEACKKAAPIFTNAIREMSLKDALGILKGADTAATVYLKNNTQSAVTASFRPVIEESLQKVNATKYWESLVGNYNKISLKKINPDLVGYVTEKAMAGIFTQIAEEEKKIRRDPLARSTDLLKKVFGNSN